MLTATRPLVRAASRASRGRTYVREFWPAAVLIVLALGLWELLTRVLDVPDFLWPSVSLIAATIRDEAGSLGSLTLPEEDDVEQETETHLTTEWVHRLLALLSPDQRDVLTLRIMGDLSVEQAAEALGKTPWAVKSLQRRGLATLRRLLGEETIAL
jgi:RNA polymerase sigma factor (sigma-70 family)